MKNLPVINFDGLRAFLIALTGAAVSCVTMTKIHGLDRNPETAALIFGSIYTVSWLAIKSPKYVNEKYQQQNQHYN